MTKETGSKRRVEKMKRLIVIIAILVVLMPTVTCLLLAVQVSKLAGVQIQLQEDISTYQTKQTELEGRIDELQALVDADSSLPTGDLQRADEVVLDAEELKSEGITEAEQTIDSAAIEAVENQLVWDSVSGDVEPWDSSSGIRRVYLTFDDGPSAYTDDILDILDAYGVKATFFVVGKQGYTEQYQRIVDEGHTLGMHSYSHKYQEIYSSLEAYRQDMDKLHDYLYELTGVDCKIARFPGGSSNKKTSRVNMQELIRYLGEVGIQYYDWNVSSGDAAAVPIDAEQIADNVLEHVDRFNTVIVLMHDAAGKKSTVEALPTIIESILQSENTVLLPITEDTIPIQHVKAQEE
ncbi:MAG: polysaccharide deacetylase [Lachnospiraceae bacterium]|nr:polysaccharide deacetylase [Lachnospiraceae bacterium]